MRSSRPAYALLEELGVLAVERPALAARERGVEHVADDAARERQPVAARLALLLEDPLAHEPVDVVVEVLGVLGERLEVLESKVLPEDGGDREKVAQLLGQPLDALLDGLLDRRGQGVGGDLRLLREAPGAGVVLRDPARVDERADELLREERDCPPSRRGGAGRASSETFGAPTSDSTSERCSEGEKGGERHETKRGSSAKESSIRDQRMPLVGLRLPVAADDRASASGRGAGRCTGAPRSRSRRRGGSRGSGRAACRRRSASASGRGARRSGSGPRPSSPRPGAAMRESPLTRRAQLRDLRELGKERDQVRREVGEVGALAGGARRRRATGSSPG